MVINVYSFMKEEAESSKVININQIQNRVSDATGVSLSSLKRILKEYENNKWGRNSAHLTKNGQEGKLKLI
jgi:signal recognition particle GTPase